jgi:hypothetical protein
VPPTGGGIGGVGGNSGSTGNVPVSGPGGGGGGGGGSNSTNFNGGAGIVGQVTVTWTLANPPVKNRVPLQAVSRSANW